LEGDIQGFDYYLAASYIVDLDVGVKRDVLEAVFKFVVDEEVEVVKDGPGF
jgi:hypothetical protein